MTQQWTQIGLIGFRLLFHGRTKKIDAESCICYDSARKAVVFCGKAEAERLKLNEAKSKAPGNRTPLLIKLVLILITNVKIKSRHYSRHQSLEQTLKHNKNVQQSFKTVGGVFSFIYFLKP